MKKRGTELVRHSAKATCAPVHCADARAGRIPYRSRSRYGMTSITYLGPLPTAESCACLRASCESPYDLPEYFDIFRPGTRPQWLLLRRADGHVVPIAFIVTGRRIAILTQLLRLAAHEFDRVIAELFGRFPSARRLEVELAAVTPRDLALPSLVFGVSADFVAPLPRRADAYLEQLGKSTRQDLRRKTRALKREFPDYSVGVFRRGAIEEEHVASIVELNRARMRAKNKVSGVDATYMGRLHRLALVCGVVMTLRADGRIIAGAICSELPGHSYLHVIAHDDAYGRFSPGAVCLLLAIEESIRTGAGEFHFLWGEAEYKRRLHGAHRPLYSFAVFPTAGDRLVGALAAAPRLARRHADRLARTLLHTLGTTRRASKAQESIGS